MHLMMLFVFVLKHDVIIYQELAIFCIDFAGNI